MIWKQNLVVQLLFLLEAKFTSVTKVKASMSQKGFITMKQQKMKVLFKYSHIKS